MKYSNDDIGVVVIGRNEGERLKRCLQSILRQTDKVVYVDSGSSDGSVDYAESKWVDVVRLNMQIPFAASRARNQGFFLVNKIFPHLRYIQFIDGDCELCEGWLPFAYNYLENNKNYAVVAGRRKEKYPEDSIYNKLCDIEWNTPIGEVEACGGDFLVRKEAFKQVDGFNPVVLASEEPEMCYRMRKKKWCISRLDHLMTIHDAAMICFSQWWKRNVRMGHSCAHMISLGLSAFGGKSYFLKLCARMWFWGLIFPVTVLILAIAINFAFLFFFIAYLVQFARNALHVYNRLGDLKSALICSFFSILGRWPQLMGQILFLTRKYLGKTITNIEYI